MQSPFSPSRFDASSSFPSSETFMVGFVIVNIVGIRHYSGTISGREMVALVREPLNPYDPNAIKVLNTLTHQVGHIERFAAAVLAPLIDSQLIIVEGIVPKPPQNRNPFKLPCQVHIFASLEEIPTIRSVISAGGLQLISNGDPAFGLSDSVIVKEKNSSRKMHDIDKVFNSVRLSRDRKGKAVVVEPSKLIVKSELFLHQKEALGWLINRENSSELPPFWEERDGRFVNTLTNYQTEERPQSLRGGILADDMGLGKTLTMISLIATNQPGYSLDSGIISSTEHEGNLSGEAANKSRAVKSAKRLSGSKKKRRLSEEVDGSHYGPKCTLVVCPLSVVSTWTSQLEEHTRQGSLKVYLYHGERTREAEELKKYDIVLTTYSTLGSELQSAESPVNQIEWLRVILDEAHVIKNISAKQSAAAINLNAKRRWVVTGTPIQNGSFDLFSLMAFLRFQPFSVKSYWQRLVQTPLDQGKSSGLSRLQVLMGAISLRRTKGSNFLVGLPPKTVHTCFVDLSLEEREQYVQMESEAKNAVKAYINADTAVRNYSIILQIILRLRQICNDINLCPPDLRYVIPSTALEDVTNNPELLTKMVSILQSEEDFDCPVCLSPPAKIVITSCAHVFCQICLLKILKTLSPRCPICRHSLTESDVYVVPPQQHNDENMMLETHSISSKVSMLLKHLSRSRAECPQTKSVVFSQFRKMLLLLQEPLKSAGFHIFLLDGSMGMKKRAQVIKDFGKCGKDAPDVLLASLKAAGTGINLSMASRMYLLEPWWNPAVEEQAMDRVHRIGQKEEVKVVRLIVRDSIEERILELQEKKRKLARGAFEKNGQKEQKQIRMEDLRAIMQL